MYRGSLYLHLVEMTFTEVEVDLMKAQGQVHQSKIVENCQNVHQTQNGGLPVWRASCLEARLSYPRDFFVCHERYMSLSIFVHVGQS